MFNKRIQNTEKIAFKLIIFPLIFGFITFLSPRTAYATCTKNECCACDTKCAGNGSEDDWCSIKDTKNCHYLCATATPTPSCAGLNGKCGPLRDCCSPNVCVSQTCVRPPTATPTRPPATNTPTNTPGPAATATPTSGGPVATPTPTTTTGSPSCGYCSEWLPCDDGTTQFKRKCCRPMGLTCSGTACCVATDNFCFEETVSGETCPQGTGCISNEVCEQATQLGSCFPSCTGKCLCWDKCGCSPGKCNVSCVSGVCQYSSTGSCESPTSTPTSTPTPTSPPSCPTCTGNITFTDILRADGSGNYNKKLQWTDVANEEKYEVLRCLGVDCDPSTNHLTDLSQNTATFTDDNPTASPKGFEPDSIVRYIVKPIKTGCSLTCPVYENAVPPPAPTPTNTPIPAPTPYCGDGIINQRGEECDGSPCQTTIGGVACPDTYPCPLTGTYKCTCPGTCDPGLWHGSTLDGYWSYTDLGCEDRLDGFCSSTDIHQLRPYYWSKFYGSIICYVDDRCVTPTPPTSPSPPTVTPTPTNTPTPTLPPNCIPGTWVKDGCGPECDCECDERCFTKTSYWSDGAGICDIQYRCDPDPICVCPTSTPTPTSTILPTPVLPTDPPTVIPSPTATISIEKNSIAGHVFLDSNGNGSHDNNEPGICANVNFQPYDTVRNTGFTFTQPTESTDNNRYSPQGFYVFSASAAFIPNYWNQNPYYSMIDRKIKLWVENNHYTPNGKTVFCAPWPKASEWTAPSSVWRTFTKFSREHLTADFPFRRARTCNPGSWFDRGCGEDGCPPTKMSKKQIWYWSDDRTPCDEKDRCVPDDICIITPTPTTRRPTPTPTPTPTPYCNCEDPKPRGCGEGECKATERMYIEQCYWSHDNSQDEDCKTNFLCVPDDNCYLPWFQSTGGDVKAQGDIKSKLPKDTDNFSVSQNGYPGVVVFGDDLELGKGNVSEKEWQVQSDVNLKSFNYSYFDSLAGEKTELENLNTKPGSNIIYKLTGNPTINESWPVTKDEKITIFIDGNLTIKENITVAKNGFLGIIVSGDIEIKNTVTKLQGFFLANKQFKTSGDENDNTLYAQGIFVGIEGFDLKREFKTPAKNFSDPVESFTFRPDFLMSLPQQLNPSHQTWQEIAP